MLLEGSLDVSFFSRLGNSSDAFLLTFPSETNNAIFNTDVYTTNHVNTAAVNVFPEEGNGDYYIL